MMYVDEDAYDARIAEVRTRSSEARVLLVELLVNAGYSYKRTAELVNDYTDDLIRLAVTSDSTPAGLAEYVFEYISGKEKTK